MEPAEVEHVLLQHPNIHKAAVIASCDDQRTRLVAYYSDECNISGTVLKHFMQARLPSYMVPELFVPLKNLPLTGNGKIDRQTLSAQALPEQHMGAYEPPDTNLESELVSIWQEVFNQQGIGISDDFFDLGGGNYHFMCFQLDILSLPK